MLNSSLKTRLIPLGNRSVYVNTLLFDDSYIKGDSKLKKNISAFFFLLINFQSKTGWEGS